MWSTFPTSISPPETQVQYLLCYQYTTFSDSRFFRSVFWMWIRAVLSGVDPDPYQNVRDQASGTLLQYTCTDSTY